MADSMVLKQLCLGAMAATMAVPSKAATMAVPNPTTASKKLRRMIMLALRHRGTHTLLAAAAAAALAYHTSRRAARQALRHRAEERLISLALAGAASRVQSAADLTTLGEAPQLSASDVSMPRSQSHAHLASFVTRPKGMRRVANHSALVELCETHRLCGACISRCATHDSLTKLDEADEGEKAEDAAGLPVLATTPSTLEVLMDLDAPDDASAATCESCEVCSTVSRSWMGVVRRALQISLGATLGYLLWLRFVASKATVRKHIFAIVRFLGERLYSYRVEGLERIPKAGPAVLTVYHGFVPLDMYFLHEYIARQLGRLPTTLVADFVFRIPLFSYLVRACGGVPAGRKAALAALREGGLVIVAPGGVREAMTTSADDYTPMWYGKSGFAEVAQLSGAPILPLFTRNIREVFLVLGGANRLVQRLYKLTRLPFTPFVGPLPQPLTTVVGELIASRADGVSAKELAARVVRALEALMRAQHGPALAR